MAALADLSKSTVAESRKTAGEATTGPRPRTRREHVLQIDVLRIVAIVAVVATHVTIFTLPSSTGALALTVVLHASRFVFFFITAFVLYLTSGGRPGRLLPFWRKRFPPVLIPYLAWTLIYWQYNRLFSWGGYPSTLGGSLAQLGENLLGGWFQLYFLIVTMQLYLAFPLIAWIVRRTRGHHLRLLLAVGALQLAWYVFMQYFWGSIPDGLRNVLGHAQEELWTYTLFFFLGAVAAAHRDQLVAVLRRYPRRLAVLTAALFGAAYALFALNLLLGESAGQAAGVFQPATVFSFLGATLGLGLIAQHLADTRSPGSRVWRFFRWGGEISFGIYLAHMVTLQLVILLQVHALLGLNRLTGAVDAVVVWTLTVGGTMLLVSILRHLPLATATTGRPRRALPAFRRSPRMVEQEPA